MQRSSNTFPKGNNTNSIRLRIVGCVIGSMIIVTGLIPIIFIPIAGWVGIIPTGIRVILIRIRTIPIGTGAILSGIGKILIGKVAIASGIR
jgi:hypothetical protein